jgi:hypothetical protein
LGLGGADLLYGKDLGVRPDDPSVPLDEAPIAPRLPDAKLLDGGSGRDTCVKGRKVVRCERDRLNNAQKDLLQELLGVLRDIKRKRGVRLSG